MIEKKVLRLYSERRLCNQSELGAYLTLLLLADWDKKHEFYAHIPDVTKLEMLTGLDNSRWYRIIHRFIDEGLLRQETDGSILIVDFEKFVRPSQRLSANRQNGSAGPQNNSDNQPSKSVKKQKTNSDTENSKPHNSTTKSSKNDKLAGAKKRNDAAKEFNTSKRSLKTTPLPPQGGGEKFESVGSVIESWT